MSQLDPHETLSKIAQHLTVIQTYVGRVAVLVAEYQESIEPPLGGLASVGSNSAIHSLQVWAEYLAKNGPTARGELHEVTGVNLTKSGYDRTHAWVGPMTYMPDDAFPSDAVVRIKGLSTGVGRPPTIYFLWSQRWDVRPKFGVGPEKPHNMPALLSIPDELPEPDPERSAALTEEIETLLSQPVRFATIEEWDAHHAPTFDALVWAESKPTDEQKQALRDTLPEGADANAAIAIAHRNAVVRARNPQPITGVIPPRPEFPGQEVVGPHNHLPHEWGPLCQVSGCYPT